MAPWYISVEQCTIWIMLILLCVIKDKSGLKKRSSYKGRYTPCNAQYKARARSQNQTGFEWNLAG